MVLHLRDVHRCVREEVGWCNFEAAGNLFWRGHGVMLNIAVLGLHLVGAQVGNGRNVWVRNLAVVTFVIVIGEDFPVVFALHLPSMIINVIVEVVILKSRLGIHATKIVIPGYFRRRLAIQIDPDESIVINVYMDRQKAVLGLVKVFHVLITRRFGQLPVQSIRPSMILAGKHAVVSLFFRNDGKSSMPANIMERIDASRTVLANNELEPSHLVAEPVPRVRQPQCVGCKKPFLGENRPSFKLIHFSGSIPRCWQCPHRVVVFFRFRWCGPPEAKRSLQ